MNSVGNDAEKSAQKSFGDNDVGNTLGKYWNIGIDTNPMGASANLVKKAFGLGTRSKIMRNDAAGWGSQGIGEVSQDAYNRYGDLRNLYNEGKQQSDWAGSGQTTGTMAVKKGSATKGHKTSYRTQYGLGQTGGDTAGDYALNQYRDYLLGGGSQGAQDWLNSRGTTYANSMGEGNTALRRSYSDALDAMINQGVTERDTAAFEEAKAKLDAQKAYGYLSDTGYANALAKLQGQTGMNQNAMRQAGVGAQSNYLTDYDQRYAQIQNNPWDWAQYQNDYTQDQDWLDFQKYAQQNALSQDYLNSLMDSANLYTPEEWIAYGAGTQGQYNPYEDFTSGNRKRKKNYNDNINEV